MYAVVRDWENDCEIYVAITLEGLGWPVSHNLSLSLAKSPFIAYILEQQ